MRPITETISLEEARDLLFEAAVPIERTERIPLGDSLGRVVARAVTSKVDVPPFDRAAMDGYAVIAEDTFGAGPYDPRTLHCVERVYTGQVPTRSLARGECIEIAHGCPASRRRRRGRDGRRNREGIGRSDSRPDAGLSASARRAARRRHRGRATGACSRRSSDPQPDRCARRHRHHRGRRLRSPAHRDPLDRQRNRRTWFSRLALARSTTSTALRCRRSSRHTAAFRWSIRPRPTRSRT